MRTSIGNATGPLCGVVTVPGDKSIAHRALIFGALARGGLRISGLPDGEDVGSTRRCLSSLGVAFEEGADGLLTAGGTGPLTAPREELDCGNSGTTMRLLMGILAGQPFDSVLTGDASLLRRPMARVADPLRAMGAQIELAAGDRAPVTVRGGARLQGTRHVLAVPSAQVKSAILLAGLFADGITTIGGPTDTRDHTERMLAWLAKGECIEVGQQLSLTPAELVGDGTVIEVPGDPSSAAFLLAAAALVPGSEITVDRVGLNPTRTRFFEELKRMGARLESEESGVQTSEPSGQLRVVHEDRPLAPVFLAPGEARHLIDEIPILAVLASQATGESRLSDLGELRHKESDRLAAIAAGLQAMGADARIEGDDLVINGPRPLHGASITTHGDHRIAMSFAVATLIASGETILDDADCIAVSYPRFLENLAALQ